MRESGSAGARRGALARCVATAVATLVMLGTTVPAVGSPREGGGDPAAPGGVDHPKGAGVVSSGVALPPIPPVTGDRRKPVPSWGKPLPYPIVIADRRNNRLLEVTPDKRVVCGKVVWSVQAPRVRYPSDAFPTVDGKRVIVVDFSKPGRVVIFDPLTRKVVWEYFASEGAGMLDHPSLARELPDTGDVIVADDLRHRVIVIDRQTKEIVWQYGVTDTPGHAPGYLYYPDGFDLNVFRDWRATSGRR